MIMMLILCSVECRVNMSVWLSVCMVGLLVEPDPQTNQHMWNGRETYANSILGKITVRPRNAKHGKTRKTTNSHDGF